jgi:hypothetical protein
MRGRMAPMQPYGGSPMQVGMLLPVFPAPDHDGHPLHTGFSPMAREFHPEAQLGMFSLVPVDAIPGPPALALPQLSESQANGDYQEKHADALRRAESKHRDDAPRMRTVHSMSTADGSRTPSDSESDPRKEPFSLAGTGLEPGVPFFVDDE